MKKALILIALTMIILSAVPRLFNYQGRLLNTDGIGIDDVVDITFRIYDDVSGGIQLWEENHLNVSVSKGLFSVELGQSDNFDTLSFSRPYWLEVIIDGESLFPRERLTSVPYAIQSDRVLNAIQSVKSSADDTERTGRLMFRPGEGSSITDTGDEIIIEIGGTSSGIVAEKPLIGDGTAMNRLQVDYDDVTIGIDLNEKLFVLNEGITNSQIADGTVIRDDLSAELLADLDDAVTLDGYSATDFAPSDNSDNYIQNQTGIIQSAGFNIDGNAYIGGNMGIGTTNPSSRLEVCGTKKYESQSLYETTEQTPICSGDSDDQVLDAEWRVPTESIGSICWDRRFNLVPNRWYKYEVVDVSDTTVISVLGSGNVGIGTTDPEAMLHIYGGEEKAGSFVVSDDAPSGAFTKISGHSISLRGVNDPIEYSPRLPYIEWRMGNNTRAMYFGWGYTGDPNAEEFDPIEDSRHINMRLENHFNLAITGGKVGIGTTNPDTYTLYVDGTIYSTGGYSSSDINLKKNIQPLSNILPKLDNITGIRFDWRKEEFPERTFEDKTQIGLIAQEVEKEFPELINYDNEGYKALSYNGFIPVLLEGIKELEDEIESRDNQIENLQKQIDEQQEQINQLKILIQNFK